MPLVSLAILLSNVVFFFQQRNGRVHLRRNGVGLSGGAGRGLPFANRGILVRHDWIRPRVLQEFQVSADVQQASAGLQRQRYRHLITVPFEIRLKGLLGQIDSVLWDNRPYLNEKLYSISFFVFYIFHYSLAFTS